jgi:inosine-uridine nucleoside N-ribohydrolase
MPKQRDGSMTTPILLDVDTGMDDALALGLAVLDPAIELVAATTVAGNVEIDHTTPNTLTILDWFGATDVPVYRGASRPLARALRTAAEFQGDDGLGESGLEPSRREPAAEPAPAAIIRLARSRPGEITLVCVGPLTNLAIALNIEPTLPDLVAGVVIMGGAFYVPGNITEHAEFNIYCDPEAAAQVFEAADWFRRFTAIGLDVCHQVALTQSDYLACQTDESPGARLFARVARRQFQERQDAAFYLYDPLALAVAVAPDLVRHEDSAVTIDFSEEHLGRTRVVRPGPVQVAREVDAEKFLARFRSLLELPLE